MSQHVRTVTGYPIVTCDICGERVTGAVTNHAYDSDARLVKDLVGMGWRVYAGRGRRHYCPDCAPARGHKMRLVYGEVQP